MEKATRESQLAALQKNDADEWNGLRDDCGWEDLLVTGVSLSKLNGAFDFRNVTVEDLHLGAHLAKIRLDGATLRRVSLDGVPLLGVDFAGCRLEDVNLRGARAEDGGLTFSRATLVRVVAERDATKQLSFSGAKLASAVLSECRFAQIEFHGVDFSRADVCDSRFEECSFQGTSLDRATFRRGSLLKSSFWRETSLDGAQLLGVDCQSTRFTTSTLDSLRVDNRCLFGHSRFTHVGLRTVIDLGRAVISDVTFVRCALGEVDFRGAGLSGTRFESCAMKGARLGGADLRDAFLGATDSRHPRCDLQDADLDGARLEGTVFEFADLSRATLIDVSVDGRTKFRSSLVGETRIKRLSLESLRDYGDLPRGLVAKMDVIDDVVRLRSSFSGFWQWVHLSSLVVFLAPYASFLGYQWFRSRHTVDGAETVSVWTAFWRFVWSHGQTWSEWSFGAGFLLFVMALAYNGLRAALLYKTKTLELTQEATGLPADCSLGQQKGWERAFELHRLAFWAYLAIVLLNSALFLARRVTVEATG